MSDRTRLVPITVSTKLGWVITPPLWLHFEHKKFWRNLSLGASAPQRMTKDASATGT
jgi:hypothetical protein